MILGITGGTGCGKSTLLKVIEERGLVLDCDAIYHELLRTDADLLNSLRSRFPEAFENGLLQRKKLGNIVFHDAAALADLNAITHGAIRREVEKRLQSHSGLAAIDAYALFESGLNEICDITVAVTAPEADRLQRLMVRDGISLEYAKSRLNAQHSPEWFRERCTYELINDCSLSNFYQKCIDFLHENDIILSYTKRRDL